MLPERAFPAVGEHDQEIGLLHAGAAPAKEPHRRPFSRQRRTYGDGFACGALRPTLFSRRRCGKVAPAGQPTTSKRRHS
jgi:hypothetical protein